MGKKRVGQELRGGGLRSFSVVVLAEAARRKEEEFGGDTADLRIHRNGRVVRYGPGESPAYRLAMKPRRKTMEHAMGRAGRRFPKRPGGGADDEEVAEYKRKLRHYHRTKAARQRKIARWQRRLDYRKYDNWTQMARQFRVRPTTVRKWLLEGEVWQDAMQYWRQRRSDDMAARVRQAIRVVRADGKPVTYGWVEVVGGVGRRTVRRYYGELELAIAAVDDEDASRQRLAEAYRKSRANGGVVS